MATWTEVLVKESNQVVWFDGTVMTAGQRYGMGCGSVELDLMSGVPRISRYSGGGHFKYALKMTKRGKYLLGPERGHRVIPPEEEKDPIKRVLRERGVSVTRLEVEITDQFHLVGGEYYTDGVVKENGIIEKPSFVVVYDEQKRRVEKVYAWLHCNHALLADALVAVIHGEGADAAYHAACEDRAKAVAWIKSRGVVYKEKGNKFQMLFPRTLNTRVDVVREGVTPHNRVLDARIDVWFPPQGIKVCGYPTSKSPLSYLVQRHGIEVVMEGGEEKEIDWVYFLP